MTDKFSIDTTEIVSSEELHKLKRIAYFICGFWEGLKCNLLENCESLEEFSQHFDDFSSLVEQLAKQADALWESGELRKNDT